VVGNVIARAETIEGRRIGAAPAVRLSGVAKRYGETVAVAGVDLDIATGTIHALVGENGAGKSTIGKLIAGVTTPDAGTIEISGARVRYRHPRQALRDGTAMIAQEMALVPWRSALENVFLGAEPGRFGLVRPALMRQRFDELCRQTGFAIDPAAPVGALRLADQQKVEILRALARDAQLFIMDEPTAALPADDAAALLRTIVRLRDDGATIVLVSHFLDQVLDVADTVSVMRDGRLVSTRPAKDLDQSSLLRDMLGRELSQVFPAKTPPSSGAPVVCSVRGASDGRAVHGVDLDLRAGEILGVAGLVGAGRSELAHAMFGAGGPRTAIRLTVDGREIRLRRPADAIAGGLALVPESRKTQGLVAGRSVLENAALAHLARLSRVGMLDSRRLRRQMAPVLAELDVRAGSYGQPVGSLSGGNQQKVLFARWLCEPPRVLIADEPTRGVDLGAKAAIYRLLVDLARGGMAVLLISSELEEVLGLAHRVLVMRQGRVEAELEGASLTEAAVLAAAFGGTAST
jgi:simple sugar transport system ATP-binding protein/ribose transport system ATP-binding protein